ncbi:MAG: hypothetical protein L3J83_03790 [Proteobacteria bacterium]|nr:hypothetical protein [Pseudomonadota bacterium]
MKTLTINIHQDPTKHVEKFLHDWLQFGAYEQTSELQYELIGNTGKISILSMTQEIITIHGDIPSQSFMLIDVLAKDCEGDRVIEGEVIDKNQTESQTRYTEQPNFENLFNNPAGGAGFKIPMGMNSMVKISGMSKFKLILLLIIAIPLLIVIIPVAIVVVIFKIIVFKLKFK